MYYLIHILYGLFFALSLLGYALLYKTKTKLPICFFPVTAISGMTVTVYLFGLAGFLKAGCFIVIIGGWLCLWFYRNWRNIKEIITDWSIIFAFFATIWLFIITRHSGVSQVDDFRHWYRICKIMNYDGIYPTTSEIEFYTYVPGSATWIYLVTRFIGFSASNCFFAQNVLHIACLICLFSAIERTNNIKINALSILIILMSSILLLAVNYSIYELLVDTLVALVSLAALILVMYTSDYKKIGIPLFLIFSFMAIIKNACILFIVITLIIAGKKFYFSKKQWINYCIFWFGLPFLLYRLYFFRASIVYTNTSSASQDVSLARFYTLMQEKGWENIYNVSKNFILRMIDIGNDTGITICYLWLMCFLLIYLFTESLRNCITMKDKSKKVLRDLSQKIKKAIITGIAVTGGYSIALLCTYIFSMSISEASGLACFFRYFGIITAYLVGGGIFFLLKEITRYSYYRYGLISMILLIAYTMGFYNLGYIGGYKYYVPIEGFTTEFWVDLYNNVPENEQYNERSYIVLWDVSKYKGRQNSNHRLRELAKTWLRTNNIRVISSNDIAKGLNEESLNQLVNYDYLVTLSDMSEQIDMLQDYLPIKDYHVGICPLGGD